MAMGLGSVAVCTDGQDLGLLEDSCNAQHAQGWHDELSCVKFIAQS
jgi:hypothetical protein